MATGGDFSRTLEGGHEPFHEFSCSLCNEKGRDMEAEKYCEECFVYLCDSCVRNHNKYPLHKRHRLLDQSQFASVNKSALVSFPTIRCQNHPGELINIFCGNHDVVCCSVCNTLEHSHCVRTQHLPAAAKSIQKSTEYPNIKARTRALISDLGKTLNDRKADISRITKEKQHVTQTIEDFRTKVNEYFDALEKNSLAELDHIEKTIFRHIDNDKAFLETTKSKAEDILKHLESFNGDNECDLFVQVKMGLQFLNVAVEKLSDMSKTEYKPSIIFEINSNIKENIFSIKSLGSYSGTREGATHSLMSSVPTVTLTDSSVTRTQSDDGAQTFTYSAKLFGKFDVNEKSDINACDILSICQLPDDTFLITDKENKKLKRLDQSLKLLDSIKLEAVPHSVCAAGTGQAAVSLVFNKAIQFVSVGNKLKLTSSFTVGNCCRGMVYICNEIFVCCGDAFAESEGCIEVYNNAGRLQHTIPRVQRLSSVPNYITVSDDGQHLLVTSFNSCNITKLGLTGSVVNTLSHKDLKCPNGMCTDSRGQVFVCGYSSNTDVHLSPRHQKKDVILRKADGIKKPRGVHYDKRHSRILVSCRYSNELLVFSFT